MSLRREYIFNGKIRVKTPGCPIFNQEKLGQDTSNPFKIRQTKSENLDIEKPGNRMVPGFLSCFDSVCPADFLLENSKRRKYAIFRPFVSYMFVTHMLTYIPVPQIITLFVPLRTEVHIMYQGQYPNMQCYPGSYEYPMQVYHSTPYKYP